MAEMNIAALPKVIYAQDATNQILTANIGGNYGDARCFLMSIKDAEFHIFALDAGHKGTIAASAKCDAAITIKPTTANKTNIINAMRDVIRIVARAGTTELTNPHNARKIEFIKVGSNVTTSIETPITDVVIDFSASA
tara:strand:+ start:2247 stop:2660 length:414 start_codon:yes stop_codon:yes gene_type:complete